jgi:hypothetical protein
LIPIATPATIIDTTPTKLGNIFRAFEKMDSVRMYVPLQQSVDLRLQILRGVRIIIDHHLDNTERDLFDKRWNEVVHQRMLLSKHKKSGFIDESDEFDMMLRRWVSAHQHELV